MEKKSDMQINAEVESIIHGKELLDDLKALSDKYNVSIDLSICLKQQVFDAQI